MQVGQGAPLPVEFFSYKDEGHGFRDSSVNIEVLELLSDVYRQNNMFEDQIDVLNIWLKYDIGNKKANAEKKLAFSALGKDVADVDRERWESETSNIQYGIDYIVEDYHSAVITAAKAMALTVVDLLHGNGQKAKEIVDNFEPLLSKDAYLKLLRSMYKEEKFQ